MMRSVRTVPGFLAAAVMLLSTTATVLNPMTAAGASAPTIGAPSVGAMSPASEPAVAQTPGSFVSVAPARVIDTRSGLGAAGPVAAGGTVSAVVAGRGGVPVSGVSAVVVNITVTAPTRGGFLTAWAAGAARPGASNLNFSAGQTIPNLAIVPVGVGGKISLYNGSGGTVQILADVAGYFVAGAASAPGSFVSVAPARVIDTRSGLGAAGPVAAGGTVSAVVAGRGGVPVSGVSAVVVNITVTAPTRGGFLTAWAAGAARPGASNLNFSAGQTIPNLAIVPVGVGGKISLYNGSGGTVQILADVAGYFVAGAASAPGSFVSVAPARVIDTRSGLGAAGPVAAGGTVSAVVAGRGGVPVSGVSAVVVNITVTAPTRGGFLTAWAAGAARPGASNLNFSAGQTIPNLAIVPVGVGGKISLYNGSGGTVQILADVAGYYVAAPTFSWSALTTADGSGFPSQLADVSCVSSTFCIGVDTGGHAVKYNGSTWSSPVLADPGLDPANSKSLSKVSCASTTFCVAVDTLGRAVKFNGTTWSAPVATNITGPSAISCNSSTFCVVVGVPGFPDFSGQAVKFNGTTWSAPVDLGFEFANDVSCASATFCAATGGSENSGYQTIFNGSAWSAPTTNAHPMSSISCVSASFCVAGNSEGYYDRYSGSTWSAPVYTGDTGPLGEISCAATDSCVSVARVCELRSCSGTNSKQFDGAAWSLGKPVSASDSGPSGLSCPSANFCVAVFLSGQASYGTKS